jgi:hypothetical protein
MTRETSRFLQLRFLHSGSDNRGTQRWSVKIDSSLPPTENWKLGSVLTFDTIISLFLAFCDLSVLDDSY